MLCCAKVQSYFKKLFRKWQLIAVLIPHVYRIVVPLHVVRRIIFFSEFFRQAEIAIPSITLDRSSGGFPGISFLTCIFSRLRYWVSIDTLVFRTKKQMFRIACEYSDVKSATTFPVVNGCLTNSKSAIYGLWLLVTGFKVDWISLINYT
jgi:hypothetical protein